MDELIRLSARDAVAHLRRGEVSPLELIDAAVARIEAVDPAVNALPTLCVERARQAARRVMAENSERVQDPGWLAGLPVVIKDMSDVAGVRTTYGSPIFKDHVPERSAFEVERLEAAGAVVLAKSNTPEFAAGGNTFNEVFGITRNPWCCERTCGGSSGGSAVALATGMAWLATGSDLGGSLRLPASFCGVVGLRPSPGRVPQGPEIAPFQTLSVAGPLARDVADLALMLDAMAGFDVRDPRSFDAPAIPFSRALERSHRLSRVAFSADLGGITPVAPEVSAICAKAAARIAELGVAVDQAAPDLSGALDVFTALRAELYAAERAPLLDRHRAKLKPEVIWNIEKGLALDCGEIGRAERERGLLLQRLLAFFDTYDLLLCPTAIVPPFAAEVRYPEALGEHRFATYVDWATPTLAFSITGCPALSLPCGFTGEGLPIGIQLVGPPRSEAVLLATAQRFEEAFAQSIAAAANAATFVPELGVFSVSYLFTGLDHFKRVLNDEQFNAMLDEIIDSKGLGLRRIATFTAGARNVYNNKGPVATVEDLGDMKMRVMASPIESQVWTQLGTLPVSIPFGDVYTGMQTGLVEGAENAAAVYASNKHYEVAPYYSLTGHQWLIAFLFMNEEAYQALPEEARAAIDQAGKNMTDHVVDFVVESDARFVEEMSERYGVQVNEVDTGPFVDRLGPLQDEVAAELGMQDIVARIRELRS